jgi:hypothetical protein
MVLDFSKLMQITLIIKCYELKQVMHQSDEQFINNLNGFQIVTQL